MYFESLGMASEGPFRRLLKTFARTCRGPLLKAFERPWISYLKALKRSLRSL
jgi:hypothetical protein